MAPRLAAGPLCAIVRRMRSTTVLVIAILFFVLLAGIVWYAVLREERHGVLTVSFLDIGQGDSIYIESPTGTQVLIDGGADSSVLRRLSEKMPWYDRSLDLVIGTHPDADHIGGLIDVFARYKVATILHSSVSGDTSLFRTFVKTASAETPNFLEAERGEVIELGGGAYLEVLAPDRSVPGLETNTGCLVTRLVYGETSFMLPCDAPAAMEKYLVALDGERLRSTVLKPGHHGSKTSSSPIFVGYVDPEYAVFSRGCDNKYGHPSPETVETLAKFHIPTKDTCIDGTVTFVSDGKSVMIK
jgi:competence protein ComEC